MEEHTCFSCGQPIETSLKPCPNCGYMFDGLDEIYMCPNLSHGVCMLTENCCMREDYHTCPTKNKYDQLSF